jgi:hypothetical protein
MTAGFSGGGRTPAAGRIGYCGDPTEDAAPEIMPMIWLKTWLI